MDERNYNDTNEFILSTKRSLRRFKSCVKKGVIYFYDKYDDDTRFSQIYTEDIKEEVRQINQKENKS